MVSLGELEVNLPFETLKFASENPEQFRYLGTDCHGEYRYNLQIAIEKDCRISIKIQPLRTTYSEGYIKTFIKEAVKLTSNSLDTTQEANNDKQKTVTPGLSPEQTNQKRKPFVNLNSITTSTLPVKRPREASVTSEAVTSSDIYGGGTSLLTDVPVTTALNKANMSTPLLTDIPSISSDHQSREDSDRDSSDGNGNDDEDFEGGDDSSDFVIKQEPDMSPAITSLSLTEQQGKDHALWLLGKDQGSSQKKSSSRWQCDIGATYGKLTGKAINGIGNNECTKKSTRTSVNTFKDYLSSRGKSTDIENNTREELDLALGELYVNVRKADGSLYKSSAIRTIRFGIARYLQSVRQGIDIIHDVDFIKSNTIHKSYVNHLDKIGLVTEHILPIADHDLHKLYSCGVFDTDDPTGLQRKVFFEIFFYLNMIGRDNMRQKDKNSYIICYHGNRKCVKAVSDGGQEKYMYQLPGNPYCPVLSFEKYVNKLCPTSELFWQRPKIKGQWANKIFPDETESWYLAFPLGKNTLGKMMHQISEDAQLSQIYTNSSIKLTNSKLEQVRLQDFYPQASQLGIINTKIETISIHIP